MAILKPRTDTSTKVLGLRIPGTLHREYEQIRKAADEAGLVLSVNALLTESLVRILRQAQAELRQAQAPRTPDAGREA
jgi:hypothetical protein